MAWGDDAQAEADALELRIDKEVGEQRRAISRSAVRMLDLEFESWNLGRKSGSDWESPRRAWALEQLLARRSVDHHAYSPEPSDAAGSDVELVPLADDDDNNADGIATPPDDSPQPHPRSPLQQLQQQRPLPLSSEEAAPQEEAAAAAAGAAAGRFSNASSAAPVPALDGPPSMHPAHGGGRVAGGMEYPGIMSFVSPQSYALSADTALSDTLPMMALSRSQLSGENALARLEDMGVTDIDLRIAKLERLLADPAAAAAPTPLRATPPPQRRRGTRPAGDWVLSSASASPSPQRGGVGGGGGGGAPGFGGGGGGYGDTDASSTPSPRSDPPAYLGRPETPPHEFSDVPDGTSSRALSERGSGGAATRDGATALTSAHGDVETPSEADESDGGGGGRGGGGFSSDPEDSRSAAGAAAGAGVAASAASAGSFLRSPSLHASGAGAAPSSASASGDSSGGGGEGFCCLIVVTEETVIVVGRGGSSSGDGSADDSKEAAAERKRGTVLRAKVTAGAATSREDVATQVGAGVYAEEGLSLEALAKRLRASDPRRRRGGAGDGGDRLSLVLQVSVEEGSTAAEAARGLGSFVEAVTHSNAACSVVLEAADAALAEALLRSAPRAARADLSAAEFALADALMPASGGGDGGGDASPAVRVSALSWVGSETPPQPPQLLSLAHAAPCDSVRVPPSPPRSEASSQLGGSSSSLGASEDASVESEVESYQESPPALSMSAGAGAAGVEVGNLVLASHTTEGPWVEGCVISRHMGVSWVQQAGSPQLPATVFRHLRKVGKAE